MSKTVDPISEQDIHAYIDKQLSAQRATEVSIYIENNPEELVRVQKYQQLNNMLQQRHNRILQETVPKRLTRFSYNIKNTKRYLTWAIAASLSWAFVGGIVGWNIRDHNMPLHVSTVTLVQHAAMAHAVYTPEIRHPVEVRAENEKHLVHWLSKRLSENIRAPNLNNYDFELMGGRLLPSEDAPAAQLMYENSLGTRLTLYIRSRNDTDNNTAFRYAREDNISIFYWIDNSLGYALSGEIDKDDLLNIATTIYESLDKPKE